MICRITSLYSLAYSIRYTYEKKCFQYNVRVRYIYISLSIQANGAFDEFF